MFVRESFQTFSLASVYENSYIGRNHVKFEIHQRTPREMCSYQYKIDHGKQQCSFLVLSEIINSAAINLFVDSTFPTGSCPEINLPI